MANTTNYNWETPDDTDLVKDGAAAIRTLGSSVDTTTKALNPSTTLGDIEYRSATANTNTRLPIGTTGQILSVVAGVPSWVANDVGDITEVAAGTGISGGGTSGSVTITNSMATAIDAKGDLIGGTGADTFARLAVGANDTVLTADSTAATGLKWATPASGGGMTSIASGSLSGSSLSLTSISGSYNDLVLYLTNWAITSDTYFQIRLNNDATANIYQYIQSTIKDATLGTGQGARSDGINLSENFNPKSGARNSTFAMTLTNYANTTAFKNGSYTARFCNQDAGASPVVVQCVLGYGSASAITRIDINVGASTFSGTYVLYGVK